MGRKRYSANFERDWDFYTRNRRHFTFGGSEPPTVEHDPNGPDAKRTFLLFDSQGKLKPTSEPALLREVLICKASVNLHVKMWAEGLADGTMWAPDLMEIARDYEPPRWFWEALWRQATKLHLGTPLEWRADPNRLPTQMDVVQAVCKMIEAFRPADTAPVGAEQLAAQPHNAAERLDEAT